MLRCPSLPILTGADQITRNVSRRANYCYNSAAQRCLGTLLSGVNLIVAAPREPLQGVLRCVHTRDLLALARRCLLIGPTSMEDFPFQAVPLTEETPEIM